MASKPHPMLRVGVDTGGTFTDLVVAARRGPVAVLKVRSTPEDPSRAVLQGLAALGLERSSIRVVHGTTVATNALLQRRGGRVALVTTAGFEDVLALGRQNRPLLFRLDPPAREPLLADRFRLGVAERCGPRGEVLRRLKPASLRRLRARLRRLNVESVAVCLLHAYANPRHEREVARALRGSGWHLSLSHRVAGEFREYERTCTTVANALLVPPMEAYLGTLRRRLGSRRLRIMSSSGGWIPAWRAAAQPVRTVLSGPAGGIVAAMSAGRACGIDRLITLDVGGTSTDISVCEGREPRIQGTVLERIPLRIPSLDIQSIGAGGGSQARVDAGGALRVGPESAGADPGPACYSRGGTEATVTDALFFLGRLPEEGLLGGEIPLDRAAAERSLRRIGQRLGVSARAAAHGILQVANAALETAVRRISAGRGHHPARFALLAFGGAGGLLACPLASALGIERIVIPRDPGAFSAFGLCSSPPIWEVSRTVIGRAAGLEARELRRWLGPLEEEAVAALVRDGHPASSLRLEREADLRYRGQSHELSVPVRADLREAFHRAHGERFGYDRRDDDVELVNLRVRALAPAPRLATARSSHPRSPASARRVAPEAGPLRRSGALPRHRREDLPAGRRLHGPALITEYSATTYLAPDYWLEVDRMGLLHLRRRAARP
ncbi:MAG TPA: hydantoinase/oxoprolinase family protein [Candidatus Polarisedimenticolia bacterium]|jgi:N-methylhydantoinase A/oxoprolinase/acetone carboxylase beta subunit|nr:hydantoinase/oxoprolinase family protein [Candidatus Polarisedimenticolia bacterium]